LLPLNSINDRFLLSRWTDLWVLALRDSDFSSLLRRPDEVYGVDSIFSFLLRRSHHFDELSLLFKPFSLLIFLRFLVH
jgi:hypothetical protein